MRTNKYLKVAAGGLFGIVGIYLLSTTNAANFSIVVNPVADTYVTNPTDPENFQVNRLRVSSATNGCSLKQRQQCSNVNRESLLKFDISQLPKGATVSSAKLRLYVIDGSDSGGKVYGVSSGWVEDQLNWLNKPFYDSQKPVATIGRADAKKWVETTVDINASDWQQVVSFVIVSSSTDPVSYASREASAKPQLILNYTVPDSPPPTDTATNLPTIQPIWSDMFAQSMGINTHFKDTGGDQGIYADKASVAAKVKELKVRLIRERMANNAAQNTARDLLRGSGVKWQVFMASMTDYNTIMNDNTVLDGLFKKIAQEPSIYDSVASANEPNDDVSFSVSNKSINNGVAYLSVTTPHTLEVSEVVKITGVGNGFDGIRTITSVNGQTIGFATTASNYAAAATTGTIYGHTYGAWQNKIANIQKKVAERKAAISQTLTGQAKLDFDAIKIVGPSLKNNVPDLQTDFAALANATPKIADYLDYGDLHVYPGGNQPTYGVADRVQWSSAAFGGKPLYMTETGYNNGIEVTGYGTALPESASAVYAPKQYLDLYHMGFKKVLLYELLDSPAGTTSNPWEENFGLVATPELASTGWRNKPSFNEVAQLAEFASDPGPVYSPQTIKLDIKANDLTVPVKSLVFSKRDGSSFVVLWRDVKTYNAIKKPSSGWPGSTILVNPTDVTIATASGTVNVPVGETYRWVQVYPEQKIIK